MYMQITAPSVMWGLGCHFTKLNEWLVDECEHKHRDALHSNFTVLTADLTPPNFTAPSLLSTSSRHTERPQPYLNRNRRQALLVESGYVITTARHAGVTAENEDSGRYYHVICAGRGEN